MHTPKLLSTLLAIGATSFSFSADYNPSSTVLNASEALQLSSLSNEQTGRATTLETSTNTYKSFTGKVLGSQVRMRTGPDTESEIVRDLDQDELVVVLGETNDFYEIAPPSDIKAFIFRSFVLENTVEGNRVNVRLSPDLDSPIIASLNTGDEVEGTVSEENSKWLEINPPENCRFYIAKEFIEYAGAPNMKEVQDRRFDDLSQLMDKAFALADRELEKPFSHINYDQVSAKFAQIIDDYSEFSEQVEKAKLKLATSHELYLEKKLTHFEAKAAALEQQIALEKAQQAKEAAAKPPTIITTDKMKSWEPLEQAIFSSWEAMHHAKSMNDFYDSQMSEAMVVSGIVEHFSDPVKNKPGSHIVTLRNVPQGYIYSTHIDLDEYVGKQVNLVVHPRPNNSFAFPAYYVFEATH